MTGHELHARIESLSRGFKSGQLTNSEFIAGVSWLTLASQGVAHPTAAQMRARMAEVAEAARLLDENPSLSEIDTASSWISPH